MMLTPREVNALIKKLAKAREENRVNIEKLVAAGWVGPRLINRAERVDAALAEVLDKLHYR